jgi:uncharacterized DUF497 family protein
MLKYLWNEEKNKLLKETRGIGFEQIIDAINNHLVLIKLKHPNRAKYKKLYLKETI